MGSQDNLSEKNAATENTQVTEQQDMQPQTQAAVDATTAQQNVTDTKSVNVQPDGSRFDHIKETLELLYELFPQAFIKEGNCKPLKIGIFADLREAIAGRDDVTVTKVRAALSYYTSRLRYLFSLKEGAKRVGLDGSEGEAVSKEHAEFAKAKFDEINGKRKANRKPKTQSKDNRKNANGRKPFNAQRKKRPEFKIPGRKADVSELLVGTEVLVLSSEQHYVRGVIAEAVSGNAAAVTLRT
ncbi:MAG: RNA chaperone ProQ, partial [Succinatimonas sp.]|nr:RNA chaperone ProQ [Succinatimonas sp.]